MPEEEPKKVLTVARSIKLGDKVLEAGYDDFPVLGTTPIVAVFIDTGESSVQLALTVDQAKRLIREMSVLLDRYKPPPEPSKAVH